jgi:hypothetical protein
MPNANVAVAKGKHMGVFVVEIDGEEGWASARELVTLYGPLPLTLVAQTGKGAHIYLRLPSDASEIPSRTKIRPGIDERGEGGDVVAPPSVNISGCSYRWSKELRGNSLTRGSAPGRETRGMRSQHRERAVAPKRNEARMAKSGLPVTFNFLSDLSGSGTTQGIPL